MVAYSFKRQFAEAVAAGRKCQTLRLPRARHARPGEALQLYAGMRTKACRKLTDAACTGTAAVEIVLSRLIDGLVVSVSVGGVFLNAAEIEAFALADGFDSRQAMGRFFIGNHGEGRLELVLIRWSPSSGAARHKKGEPSPALRGPQGEKAE